MPIEMAIDWLRQRMDHQHTLVPGSHDPPLLPKFLSTPNNMLALTPALVGAIHDLQQDDLTKTNKLRA